tara:strand:- start:2084 stop:3139 length:1056 start_codon:yes stop_codon:yes gene_type:complete
MTRKLRPTSTYVNKEKLAELFKKHKFTKTKILEETNLTKQSKTVQRALKGDPVNEQVVAQLADFFEVNYDELTISEKNEEGYQLNKVILKRINDIGELNKELRNISYVQKKYDLEINHGFTSELKFILDIVNNNKIEQSKKSRSLDRSIDATKSELDFLQSIASGNASINEFKSRRIFLFFGKWNARFFEMTDLESLPPEIDSRQFRYFFPVMKQIGFLLFTKIESEYKVPDKLMIYPENVYSKDNIRNHFKKILTMSGKKSKDITGALHFYDADLKFDDSSIVFDPAELLPFEFEPELYEYDPNGYEFYNNVTPIRHYLESNRLTMNSTLSVDYQGDVVLFNKKKEADMK